MSKKRPDSPGPREAKIPGPDDIVRARRREGYGPVLVGDRLIGPGDIVPMRYQEAVAREDFEPADEEEEE